MDRWPPRRGWRHRLVWALIIACAMLAVVAAFDVEAAKCEWRGSELWCDGEHMGDIADEPTDSNSRAGR